MEDYEDWEKWDDKYVATTKIHKRWEREEFEEDSGQSSDEDITDPDFEEVWADEGTQDIWDMTEEKLMAGEIFPPDVAQLSRSSIPCVDKPGKLIPQCWVCPKCKFLYLGSKNYIADLQKLECTKCNTKNPVAYDWTLTRCELNGISLNFSRVYNQRNTPYCVLFAFLASCDLMRRVRGARRSGDEATIFDVEEMHKNYEKYVGCRLDQVSDSICEMINTLPSGRHSTIEAMLVAACYHGVPYSTTTQYDLKLRDRLSRFESDLCVPRRLLVKGWFRVPGKDVDTIVRLIANGIPLVAVITRGKTFDYVCDQQTYYAPKAGECATHAIVLHGSGVATPDCDLSKLDKVTEPVPSTKGGKPIPPEVFFKARNSYGDGAHPNYESKMTEGADFNVWAVHLHGDVYGISIGDSDLRS